MSIITKTIAEQVAREMTKVKKTEIDHLENSLLEKTSEYFIRIIPKDVYKVFQQYPNIFQRRSSTKLIGVGLGHKYYSFLTSLPNIDRKVELNDVEAAEIIELENKIEVKTEVYRKLKSDIEIALYNIKTYKNALAMFPEAYAFLPTPITKAVTLNLSGIRSALSA
jgi:hypothetical protein